MIIQMMKYFDNTFFKFLFGFLVILAISFSILFAVEYYQDKQELDTTSFAETSNFSNSN